MLRLEIANFQFNRHQAGQRAVIEQKVNIEILSAHLDAVFLADEGEVLAKFQNELLQVVRDRFAEIALRKLLRKIEELQHIGVKNAAAHILGNGFGHQLLGGQHIAFIVGAVADFAPDRISRWFVQLICVTSGVTNSLSL